MNGNVNRKPSPSIIDLPGNRAVQQGTVPRYFQIILYNTYIIINYYNIQIN